MEKQRKKLMERLGFRPFLILILCITAFLQFLIMFNGVKGDAIDVTITQISHDAIRATKTVEDTYQTDLARAEAEKQVEPIYTFNQEIGNQRVSFTQAIFDTILSEKKKIVKEETGSLKEERVERIQNALSDVKKNEPNFQLTSTEIEAFLNASDGEIERTREAVMKIVQAQLAKPIRKAQVTETMQQVEQSIRNSGLVSRNLIDATVSIANVAIVETEQLNITKTQALVEEARNAIEPVKILQGQIIVREGEAVTLEMMRQLELLGMLNNETSKKPMVALLLFIMLQMSFMYILFDRSKVQLSNRRKHLLVTAFVYILTLVVMQLLNLVTNNFDVVIAFLFPTAMSTMLVRILATDKAASVVTILTASSAGIIFQQNYSAVLQMDIALYILFGGFGALYFMRNMEKRKHLLHAVSVITLINLLFIAFYLLMSQASISWMEVLYYMAAGILSALLSGALTMGLLPFFESLFGVLSTMRLIELSNPNHPLFKKILTETPGTYHHSVMVANLSEAACEAIGADGLLARVAAYYHDVGKTNRPHMFIENQITGHNPHDSMEAIASAKVILAHTEEGAVLLREHKMPQEIIDIALQHHGTSTLKYFLFKAKEEGKNFDEALFRYSGPKPQSKEAAVISIADSVEAAVRSMKEPTREKIQHLIRSIIQDRLQDDQFDECDLTMKQLKIIERVLCETLNGIFHSRIEYPK